MNRKVFFDAKGKRRRYTSRIAILLGFITLVLAGIFSSSIFSQPDSRFQIKSGI